MDRPFVSLYLGLDPSRWIGEGKILHYPVIKIEKNPVADFADWPKITHLIFTSRSAVFNWEKFEGKQILAIGEATADLIRKRGVIPLVAKESTQEGVMALLDQIDLTGAYLFWPRSERSRDDLLVYLEKRGVRFVAFDLYKTIFQRPEPFVCLDHVDEIIFTSPSTVEAFVAIYGAIPKTKKITSIGPITDRAVQNHFHSI